MILPQTSTVVLTLMVLSLLFLGAWASLFKSAGKWRFELFYFDFAFGLLLAILVLSFTVGDMGYDGFSFLDDLQHGGKRQWLFCVIAGILFNLGNMLLMAAVSVAGLSVAFPIAFGVSVLVSASLGVLVRSGGSSSLIGIGCGLIVVAAIVSAMAYRINKVQQHEELARSGKAKSTRRPNPLKGIIIAVIGGALMGSIGGLLSRARGGDLGLGPYSAAALVGIGMFVSTFILNIFFMNLPVEGEPLEFKAYFKSRIGQHIAGVLGGVVFYMGLLSGMVSTSVPENLQPNPLLRLILSQGSPVLAALFGIVLWHELRGSDMRVKVLTGLMIVLFLVGLVMIGLAPMYVRAT